MELLSLFFTSFLAATFIPLSSEVLLGVLLNEGHSKVSLLLIANLGNTLGGVFTFYIGYFSKLEWAEKYLRIKKAELLKWQELIRKYGAFLSFFCWLPVIGDPIAMALGYFKVSIKKALVPMLLGKGLRYLFLIYSFDYIFL